MKNISKVKTLKENLCTAWERDEGKRETKGKIRQKLDVNDDGSKHITFIYVARDGG